MMPLLLALLASAAPLSSSDDACRDVFDRAGACASVDDTPLEGVSEPLSAGGLDLTPVEVSSTTVGFQLLAISASIATLALGLHGAQLFYALHFSRARDAGVLSSDEAQRLTTTSAVIGGGALVGWLSAVLVGGAGIAFFIFDPKDGSVAPLFQGGE